ncbi:hypothetical protein EGT07_24900 [Herbaspirillum sp. HC18]|nr:hypothetical protein EGT07_24900 [Herbaspirillum sp. HC18]
MKKFMALAAITVSVALSGNAMAHGEQPKHGGIVSRTSDDLSFELVDKEGKATIYVENHGKPVVTTGASGKLTVLNGTDKAEVPLEPGGDNSLVTKGTAKLSKGSKAIAAVTFADEKTVNVRFVITD